MVCAFIVCGAFYFSDVAPDRAFRVAEATQIVLFVSRAARCAERREAGHVTASRRRDGALGGHQLAYSCVVVGGGLLPAVFYGRMPAAGNLGLQQRQSARRKFTVQIWVGSGPQAGDTRC